jgi:hypothetical protein
MVLGVLGACASAQQRRSTPQLDAEQRACLQTEPPSGCGTIAFTREIFDTIRSNTVPVLGLPTVAVFAAHDTRPQREPYRVGTADVRGRETSIDNDEPVASTVARAIAVVLLARGFSVIDLRTSTYESGKTIREARFAIAGDVQEFWYRVAFRQGSKYPYAGDTNVRIQLRVHDPAQGVMVWQKPYSMSCRGVPPACHWSRALLVAALHMATDPELVDQFNQK